MIKQVGNSSLDRVDVLKEQARLSHKGIYLTGANQIELSDDKLPEESFNGEHFVLASFGNCRCASDAKAIRQFDSHARVPSGVEKIALGHETLQMILETPAESNFKKGDLVVITPGHSSEPIDPLTFKPSGKGVLAALGYSYRYMGGLRKFNAVSGKAPEFVKLQGFGNLFNKVAPNSDTSLVSLAHAEPFACNFGTNKNIFTISRDGSFCYGVPPRARIAYLSGTARMAMINLTIVANVPDSDLPEVVYITGSQKKLDDLDNFALIEDLRKRGTKIILIDRSDPAIFSKLTQFGKPKVVWTNYASDNSYELAVSILAEGGNLNNYAGAADPDLLIKMPIGPARSFQSYEQEAHFQINQMHHNISPNNPLRFRGLSGKPKIALLGFEDDYVREKAYLDLLPEASSVLTSSTKPLSSRFIPLMGNELITDLFIAGSGEKAERIYADHEPRLARSAAVNFIDGNLIVPIRSKQVHYVSRHQICGSNVPWHMTNTSEPHSDDMVVQACNPISFDWMVKGICGLGSVPNMMEWVEREQPFGSFFAFTELVDLPYLATNSKSFRAKASSSVGRVRQSLFDAARILESNDETWSRKVEEALYMGYGVPYPLNL